MNGLTVFLKTQFAGGGSMVVGAAPGGVFRIQVSRSPQPHEWPHYAITGLPAGTTPCSVENPDGIVVECAGAKLRVAKTNDIAAVAFELTGADGTTHLRTSPKGALAVAPGGIRLTAELPLGRQYYGLGAFGENIARVPGRYRCWNTDDSHHQPLRMPYTSIPFAVTIAPGSPASCGVFVNNPGAVTFDLGMAAEGVAAIECATGDLDLWLMPSDSPAGVLRVWSALTGRMERPPMWSLGMHQSRWSYKTEEEVREIATQYRERRIPLDVIHLDIHYMDAYRVFTWDSAAFPDPKGLMKDLAAMGIQTIPIVDPGVKVDPSYSVYVDGVEKDVFLRHATGAHVVAHVWPGESVHPDFTSPAAREWWGGQHRPLLLDAGVRGIWCDMNEPAVWGSAARVHDYAPDALHHDEGGCRTHREVHNVYGHMMSLAARDGLLAARPDERPFVLTRSGWAGMQRHTAVWTGDNRSCFGSMIVDLVHLLSLGMSGVAFAGADVGGFQDDCHAELFTRWLEWGVFQPFCRAHAAWNTRRQEPWSFGEECEDHSRRLISFRMSLLPYLYTQFVEASESGLPVMRPLVLQYPADPVARRIADQFLVGSDIMVAPILETGRDRRLVYLPEGAWYRAGERIEGSRWIVTEMPVGSLPVFMRAGAAIPQSPARMHTGEPVEELQFTVYVGPEIRGRVVEDDGISFAYRKGVQAERTITGHETPDGFEISISPVMGAFDPAAALPNGRALTMRIVAPRPVERFLVNGEAVEQEGLADAFTAALASSGEAVRIEGQYA